MMNTKAVVLASVLGLAASEVLETTCGFDNLFEGQRLDTYFGTQCFGADIPGFFRARALAGETADFAPFDYINNFDDIPLADNVLIVFDSGCNGGDPAQCTGTGSPEFNNDNDLLQIDFQKTLIIHNVDTSPIVPDGPFFNTSNPDDLATGGCIWFDFSTLAFGSVDLMAINILDVERNANLFPLQTELEMRCKLLNGTIKSIDSDSGVTGNGQSGLVQLMNTCQEATILEVCFDGSGALDDIKLSVTPEDCADDPDWNVCWYNWHGNYVCEDYYHNTYGCDWLAQASKRRRHPVNCEHQFDINGVSGAEACPEACGLCPGCPEDDCADEPGFEATYMHYTHLSCDDISRFGRCKRNQLCKYAMGDVDGTHVTAEEACPSVCDSDCRRRGGGGGGGYGGYY